MMCSKRFGATKCHGGSWESAGGRRRSDTARPRPQVAVGQSSETAAEVAVPDGVDDWIEQRVGVAEPEADAGDGTRHTTRVDTERHGRGQDEERQPAQDERADYES